MMNFKQHIAVCFFRQYEIYIKLLFQARDCHRHIYPAQLECFRYFE